MNLIPEKDEDMPDKDKPYQTRFENFTHLQHKVKQQAIITSSKSPSN